MYIENIENLDKDSLTQRDLYDELLAIESEIDRQIAVTKIREKAKQFDMAKAFDQNYFAATKEKARFIKNEIGKSNNFQGAGITNFPLLDTDHQLKCGDWDADAEGVRIHTDKGYQIVCPHQIFISRILKNAETGKYKVELVYKVRNIVRTIYVSRETIATPSKILKLADDGVQVTAITAPLLVKYLCDIESLNPELIKEVTSTSRLGWIDGVDANGNKIKQFLPYMSDVIFDNELNVKSLFESIGHFGDSPAWYKCIKKIRKKRQPEVLINLASSFASVLVEPCGALPFIVSLWGGTGKGKSVVLKICTSVWADPGEGKYITDAKATSTAMEMRLNILNSLPMTLDDMAQVKNQYDEDFSELIYRWCAGKGRDRSNKELGLNKLTSWRNCTLTNGERSLVDESTQGGAINRVIDIEISGDALFSGKEGNDICKIIEKNYGFGGEEFIRQVVSMGFDQINQIYNKYYAKIKEIAESKGVEKEEKQIMPLALILTADEITEQYLFCDGVRIDIEQAVDYLRNKGDVSEDIRAYEYLINTVAENNIHFMSDADEKTTVWGYFRDDDKIVINGTKFDEIMKSGGFQGKAFLSWCRRKGIIECDAKGYPKKIISHKGKKYRAVIIDASYGEDKAEKDSISEDLQAELPFK